MDVILYHSYFKIIEIKEKERFDAYIKSEFIITQPSYSSNKY